MKHFAAWLAFATALLLALYSAPFVWGNYLGFGILRVLNDRPEPVTVLVEFEGKARLFRDVQPGRWSPPFFFSTTREEQGPRLLVRPVGSSIAWCDAVGYIHPFASFSERYTFGRDGLRREDGPLIRYPTCSVRFLELESLQTGRAQT